MRTHVWNTIAFVAFVALATSGCSAATQPGPDESSGGPVAATGDTVQQKLQAGGGRGAMAALFAETDANKDGKVTAEEAKTAAAARFAAADVNHDGVLDKSERAAMHRGPGAQGGSKGPGHMNRNFDKSISRADAPPRLLEHFDEVDTNKDGVLDPQELRAMRDKRPQGPGMGKVDADQDGKVTAEEFTAGLMRWFTHMDQDKDGAVTQAELSAARPHRGAR
jgi:Ca2+-binding EF-hand superfamily protein